jgi:WD40 repeat protein
VAAAVGPGVVSALVPGSLVTWDLDGSERFRVRLSAEAGDPALGADVAWTPSGSHVAVTDGSAVIVVDADGARAATLSHEEATAATAVRFSADGTLLAVALVPTDRSRPNAGRIAVWNWRNGTESTSLPEGAQALAFSPDGDRLAAAYDFEPPRIWDVRTGRELARLAGHTGTVTDIEFAPGGDQLATASGDGTIRLWDSRAREQLMLRVHDETVVDVAYNDDGTRLASASEDGTARIWALDLDDLVGIAQGEVTRPLTAGECDRTPPACA